MVRAPMSPGIQSVSHYDCKWEFSTGVPVFHQQTKVLTTLVSVHYGTMKHFTTFKTRSTGLGLQLS